MVEKSDIPAVIAPNMAKQIDAVRKITTITRQIPNHPYHTFDPTRKTGSGEKNKEE